MLAIGCLGACHGAGLVASDVVVARVAGQAVLQQEVRVRFARRVRALRELALAPEAKQALWQSCVDDVVLERVVTGAARDRQVAVLEDEVDGFVRRIGDAQRPSEASAALSAAQVPAEELREAARLHLLMGKYIAYQVAARIEVTEADVAAYATERPDVLQRPAQGRLRFLRLRDATHWPPLKKAVAKGRPPADAAAQMVDKVTVGDLGYVATSALPSDVRERVERLPLHKLSEPLPLGDALAVFWLSDRRPPLRETLPQARRRIERLLRHEREAQAETHVLAQLKEAARAEVLHAAMPNDL